VNGRARCSPAHPGGARLARGGRSATRALLEAANPAARHAGASLFAELGEASLLKAALPLLRDSSAAVRAAIAHTIATLAPALETEDRGAAARPSSPAR